MRVSQEEYDLVKRRMAQTRFTNLRAYLLKQAIDGRVIHIEMESIAELGRLLRNISNNVNQIAARVNTTGNIYAQDIADIQENQSKIWAQQEEMIRRITALIAEVE
jgi:diaminopimelate decarboxylase